MLSSDGTRRLASAGIIDHVRPAPPVDANAVGPWNLPWLRRTDAERVQNLSDERLRSVDDGCWVATEKAEALAQADKRESVVTPDCLAEGIVWHHVGDASSPDLDCRLVFTAVSAAFLIKHGL